MESGDEVQEQSIKLVAESVSTSAKEDHLGTQATT
jgi:hypothetical protein